MWDDICDEMRCVMRWDEMRCEMWDEIGFVMRWNEKWNEMWDECRMNWNVRRRSEETKGTQRNGMHSKREPTRLKMLREDFFFLNKNKPMISDSVDRKTLGGQQILKLGLGQYGQAKSFIWMPENQWFVILWAEICGAESTNFFFLFDWNKTNGW